MAENYNPSVALLEEAAISIETQYQIISNVSLVNFLADPIRVYFATYHLKQVSCQGTYTWNEL